MRSFYITKAKTGAGEGREDMNTKIIAVAGKGGVGKTSLAAAIIRNLIENYPDKKILAIDADPAVGLSTALGVSVCKTIDDVRKEAIAAADEGKNAVIEVLGNAEYSVQEAMVSQNGFSFIAIGRPESAGCYCKINTYLKNVISSISDHFDYVVIDGEAGIEQINRRVMEKVTHLVLVTDQSRKGCQVVQTIKKVADELVMYDRVGVVVNRILDEVVFEGKDLQGIEPLAYIPNDNKLAVADIKGDSVFSLPCDANICIGAKNALHKMGII